MLICLLNNLKVGLGDKRAQVFSLMGIRGLDLLVDHYFADKLGARVPVSKLQVISVACFLVDFSLCEF